MNSNLNLIDLIVQIGHRLEFEVALEVEASGSAYVDVVWFDRRFAFEPLSIKKTPKIRRHPVLPVAGFEVERKTALDTKHVKGSVSNLENLGALMGVLVIGKDNLSNLAKQKAHAGKANKQLEEILMDRVYRWVYTESQTRNRIVVMWEREVTEWAKRLGVNIAQLTMPE